MAADETTALAKTETAPAPSKKKWVRAMRHVFGPSEEKLERLRLRTLEEEKRRHKIELFSAVDAGDAEKARQILQQGLVGPSEGIKSDNKDGDTPVFLPNFIKNAETMRVFLDFGVLEIPDAAHRLLERCTNRTSALSEDAKKEIRAALVDREIVDKASPSDNTYGLFLPALRDPPLLRDYVRRGFLSDKNKYFWDDLVSNAMWDQEAAMILMIAGVRPKAEESGNSFLTAVARAASNGTQATVNGHKVIGPAWAVQSLVAMQCAIDWLTHQHAYRDKLPRDVQQKIADLVPLTARAAAEVRIHDKDGNRVESLPYLRRGYDEKGQAVMLSLRVPKHLSFEDESTDEAAQAEDEGTMLGLKFYGCEEDIRAIFDAQKQISRLTREFNYAARYKDALPETVQEQVEAAVTKVTPALMRVYIFDANDTPVKNPFVRFVFNEQTKTRETRPINCAHILEAAAEQEDFKRELMPVSRSPGT
jgi:hypothetical protein